MRLMAGHCHRNKSLAEAAQMAGIEDPRDYAIAFFYSLGLTSIVTLQADGGFKSKCPRFFHNYVV